MKKKKLRGSAFKCSNCGRIVESDVRLSDAYCRNPEKHSSKLVRMDAFRKSA